MTTEQKKTKYSCAKCNFHTNYKHCFKYHYNSMKHKKKLLTCENCYIIFNNENEKNIHDLKCNVQTNNMKIDLITVPNEVKESQLKYNIELEKEKKHEYLIKELNIKHDYKIKELHNKYENIIKELNNKHENNIKELNNNYFIVTEQYLNIIKNNQMK